MDACTVLANALKLLHPYMPFITEELYSYIRPQEETIMYAAWPKYREDWSFPQETEEVEAMKEAIRGIRNIRTQMNVPPKQKSQVIFVSEDAATRRIFENGAEFLVPLAFASEVKVQNDMTGISETAVSIPLHLATAFIPLEQLVDLEKEKGLSSEGMGSAWPKRLSARRRSWRILVLFLKRRRQW